MCQINVQEKYSLHKKYACENFKYHVCYIYNGHIFFIQYKNPLMKGSEQKQG